MSRLRLLVWPLALLLAGCGGGATTSSGAPLGGADASSDAGQTAGGPISGVLQIELLDGTLRLIWPEDEYLYHCLKIEQDTGKPAPEFVTLCPDEKAADRVVLGEKPGEGGVDFALSGLKSFVPGLATWTLTGGQTQSFGAMIEVATGTMRLGPRFSGPCQVQGEKVTGLQEWNPKAPVTMDLSFTTPAEIRSTVWFATPEVFPDKVEASGSTKPGGTISLSYTFDTPGMYTIEINNVGGGAIINCGIYVGADVPVVDVQVPMGGGLSASPSAEKLSALRQELLNLLNAERKAVGLGALALDASLNEIAQYHSDNMATLGFFGHTDKNGMGPGERAKKFGFGGPIGENLSKSYSIAGANNGLFWSAAHRANMLAADWGRVGLGIAKDGASKAMLVTENFSTAP